MPNTVSPCPDCGGLGRPNGCGPDHGYEGPCHGGPYVTTSSEVVTEIINLTPHEIVVCDEEGSPLVTIPKAGIVARVSERRVPAGTLKVDGHAIHVERTEFGEVVDLPEPEEGKTFLVSALVRAACPDRSDLVSPGPLVRDDQGRPVGCRGLTR